MLRINPNISINTNCNDNLLQNSPWKCLQTPPSETPGPRAAHSCEIIGKKLYLFGGWNGRKALNDIFMFNIETNKWTELEVAVMKPGLRNNHATCTHGKYIYLHGGHNGDTWLDDLYIFDSVNLIWNKINIIGDIPSARACHTLSRVDKKIYMFGGYDGNQCYNDVEVFDTEDKTWSTLNCGGSLPLARNAHSITVVGKNLFLFGGHSGNKHLKDLFIFDTETANWYEPKFSGESPEGLRGHTATYMGNKIIIFGGYDGKGRSKELYFLNVDEFKWYHANDNDKFPGSRQRHTSVSLDNKRLLIFGGFDGMKWLNDIHILDVSILTDIMMTKCSATEYQSDMSSLINNKDFADVIFKIENDKILYGHKAIIARRSVYFYEQFKMREHINIKDNHSDPFITNKSITEVKIENLSESTLLNILEYIYTGSISTQLDFTNLIDLLSWSNEFRLKELKSLCENSLIYGMNSDNVVEILITSYKQGMTDLKTLCINFILSNFHEVSHTKTFYYLESYPSLVMEVMMLSLNKIETD
jgi:hypothetical protein